MKYVFAVLVVGILMVPSIASASSTCQAYNPQTCNVHAASTSTLPFTGISVGLLLLVAAVLIAAGLMLKVLSRRLL